MKKVLFVLGDYAPYPSANGVCIMRLQEALLAKGILSDVICEGNENRCDDSDFGKIYFVKNHGGIKLPRALEKIKNLIVWPLKSVALIRYYSHAIKCAKSETKYIGVVGVLRPIAGAIACALNGDFILYELDSITNNMDNLYGIKHLLRYRTHNIERFVYKRAKSILHLKCHEDYYKQKRYLKYIDKTIFTDIPHLVQKTVTPKEELTDDISIIYTGILSEKRNSPEYALSLIEKLAVEKKKKISCAFYSRGDCEDMLSKMADKYPQIFFRMGYVKQDELKKATSKADYFLSIGSVYTGTVTSVPSKVFEYMSTGKPIIHICGGKNDTAVDYLERYGNSILLDPNDNIDCNAEKLQHFLEKNRNTLVDNMQLREKFPLNTPEWTREQILKLLKQ